MKEKDGTAGEHAPAGKKPARRHRLWRTLGIILLVLVVIGAVGRALLPWGIRNYVNRTLDRNTLYSGRIGPVHVHLLRGAYSIENIRISKTTGTIPVPFFAARQVDFAVQWDALVHGRVVARILMDEPQLNFVDSSDASTSQTGAGGDWSQMVRDLFPFRINRLVIRNGSVHFRTFNADTPVDVYLADFNASIDNLGNIRNEMKPLVATVRASALAMNQAKFELNMTLDPFAYQPTFHLATRLLGLDVTKLNNLALAYGDFDFKRGYFDLVIEADSRAGQISGYVKPLFRNLKVFSLKQDIKEDSVLQFFWQALIGAATTIFKNQPRDQFGTLVPFTGSTQTGTSTDILATLGNLLRNAFIRAYLPRLQSGSHSVDGLTFEPPDVSSPVPGSL